MKKRGIIILGPTASGKTRLATEILDLKPNKKTIWLDGRYNPGKNGYGKFCKENTEIMLIDDVQDLKELENFRRIAAHGILLNIKFEKRTIVKHPKLIITFDESIKRKDLPKSKDFLDNFSIVELKKQTASK